MPQLRRGDVGPAVAEVWSILSGIGLLPSNGSTSHETFDETLEHAVRDFQQQRRLITDGLVGPATYRAMLDATYTLGARPLSYTVSAPMTGDDVHTLQERLLELGYDAGRPDGMFEGQTEQALRGFQRDMGLTVDGICGATTVRTFRQLSPKVRGGRPVFLRERERMRTAGPRLRGKRIVIDPGHGGGDRGVIVNGVSEADIVFDLARRLEGRMVATGMDALLTRGPHQCPSEAERAHYANNTGADLFLSLHNDGVGSPQAQGLASFHFGTGNGTSSTIGEALAGFIQREVSARTGMLDCRSHGRSWDSLRMTRCPAVRVEVGYLTNAADRARLVDAGFLDRVAEGILIAVKRLYLLGEGDQPTGTFTFADVLRHELAKAE
jgi:N-acetylmuramoyl-L-alanine amidase